MREIRDRSGKSVWAEKTAFDSFHIDQIGRLCGDRCRYICITRHALDQVCSVDELCRKMQMFPRELHRNVQRHSDYYEAFAHAWNDVTRRLLRFANDNPAWCVLLRYEDLTRQPAVEMKRILEHLALPTDVDAMITAAMGEVGTVGLGDWKTYESRKISTRSVGRRRELSQYTIKRLAPIVNPTIEAAGYEPITGGGAATEDAEAARHANELGLMVARMRGEAPREDPGSSD